MLEQVADKVAYAMCNQLNTTEQDRLTYKYGLEILLSEVSKYSLLLLLFYAFGDFQYGLSSFLCLLWIRRFVGGYHVKTYWGCFGTTLGILLLGKVGDLLPVYILNIVGLYALTLVWRYAPVYSRNKRHIKDSAKLRMRWGALLSILSLMCINTWYTGSYSAFAVIAYVTVFLITPSGSRLIQMEAVKDEELDEENVCNE